MPEPEPDRPVDVAVGCHPDHGIVATSPSRRPASTWMLQGFGFQPVPDHPHLHVLLDQHHDGADRATRAVALLRKAGHRVQADAAFDPDRVPEPTPGPVPAAAPAVVEPDVAFSDHPRLGVVAAVADGPHGRHGALVLEVHGWSHQPQLDIFTLPAGTDRTTALGRLIVATTTLHRSDLRVAAEPRLAADARHRLTTAAAAAARPDRGPTSGRRMRPGSAAALAASPARATAPGIPPVAASARPGTAAGPVDPRIAFSRTR